MDMISEEWITMRRGFGQSCKKTTADSGNIHPPGCKGWYWQKTEIEILTECLEDAKDSLENLEKYNEQLQALDGKTPDTETVVLIQDLDDKNGKSI